MSAVGIKTLGAMIVMLCTWLLSARMAARRKAATAQIEGFLTLFSAIREGISRYVPISEVLDGLSDEVLGACMGTGGVCERELSALFARCVCLCDGLETLVTQAAQELGRGYRTEQLAVCDRYLEAFSALYEQCERREGESRTLLVPLMTAGAAGVILLLL